MSETSASLFECLRTRPDAGAWERLVDLYTPMIRNWLVRYSLRNEDVEDLVQEVLARLLSKLPEFKKEPRTGAFRCWLRGITVNCLREFWRAQRWQPRAIGGSNFAQVLEELEDPDSSLSQLWNQEHDDHVTRRLLEMIKPRFEAITWQAFQRHVLEGASVDEVARDLGLSPNAVFIAKSRVLRLLRQESQVLID
jgi:RNA polymerase sigma-70 factor, ECF subfamily